MPLRDLRRAWILTVALALGLGAYTAELTPVRRSALDLISAQSLRGHVSFLASDLLEGRDTPSRGLDIAAEYIAAQFRRAGLKPAGDDGYFQTADFILSEQRSEGAALDFQNAGVSLSLGRRDLRVSTHAAASIEGAAPLKFRLGEATVDSVEGKVALVTLGRAGAAGRHLAALRKLNPAAVVFVHTGASPRAPESTRRLFDPERPRPAGFPVVNVYSSELYKLVDEARPGALDAKLSLSVPAPSEKTVQLRNVAGILPGSDPMLADTYVLLTAHYDHVGVRTGGEGDNVFNGANDDASGVAAVIEVASALSRAGTAPRRSILFLTYFGEENGLLGSRYYGRHPLVPIEKTVANLNLEHLGRSDGDLGPGAATMTGYDYSDLSAALELAGAATGVSVKSPEAKGDSYFARSDNQALADLGVPAHTLVAAFEFPDYHGVGDHWQKLDYPNFERITRAVTLTVLMAADSVEPPKWNAANPKTEKYRKAAAR